MSRPKLMAAALGLAALLVAGACDAPAADAGPGAGLTFGTQPCAKLVAFEEIAAATGIKPVIVDVVSETQCNYEQESGANVMSLDRFTDPANQPSCVAGGTEALTGIGDSASWSADTRSVCLVKGATRVQITLGAPVADPKSVAVGMATSAAHRLP